MKKKPKMTAGESMLAGAKSGSCFQIVASEV